MKKLYIIHGWTYTVKPWEKTLSLLRKKGVKVEMLNVLSGKLGKWESQTGWVDSMDGEC